MIVLGIETSCDDTSSAVVKDGRQLLSLRFASQVDVHQIFGGVVPELASRAHLDKLPAIIEAALQDAKLRLEDVDGIVATRGPGLMGALMVGVMAAKGLAAGMGKPYCGVNHLQAHLVAPFLESPGLEFPFLGLLVSGGHTLLCRFEDPVTVVLLGKTRDDAAGEAFDKIARAMGLGYPGGRPVELAARQGDGSRVGLPKKPALADTLDFSFSGLKTAMLRQIETGLHSREDLCAGLQESIVSALATKLDQALAVHDLPDVVVAGGVAANGPLRERLAQVCARHGRRLHVPSPRLCTDNGAMVAVMGSLHLAAGRTTPFHEGADPNLTIDRP